jgi:plasmid stabilization system protein ParE
LKIIWAPEALEDLEAAIDFLVERSPSAAARLVEGITARVEQLASEPHDGPEHVLATGERVRGWPHPPFRIYYQRASDIFVVLRIYHQRRRPVAR